MAFKNTFNGVQLLETPEEEVARLAKSPVGSKNHRMSQLPVNIRRNVQDLIIELPWDEGNTVVVVPFEMHERNPEERGSMPYKRYDDWWRCLVVASNNPSYPVGGYRLSIPEAELVRGTQRTLELTQPAAAAAAA